MQLSRYLRLPGLPTVTGLRGSTVQTAGFDPAAVNAVQGNAICCWALALVVPATALPSVIAVGGYRIFDGIIAERRAAYSRCPISSQEWTTTVIRCPTGPLITIGTDLAVL